MSEITRSLLTGKQTPIGQQTPGPRTDTPSNDGKRPTNTRAESPPHISAHAPEQNSPKPSPKKAKITSSTTQNTEPEEDGYAPDESVGYGQSVEFNFEGPPPQAPNLIMIRYLRTKAACGQAPGLNLEQKKEYAQTLFNLFEKLNTFKPTDNEMRQLIIKSSEETHKKQAEAFKLSQDSCALAQKILKCKNHLAPFDVLTKWAQHIQCVSGLTIDFKTLSEDNFTVFKTLLSKSDLDISQSRHSLNTQIQTKLSLLEDFISQNSIHNQEFIKQELENTTLMQHLSSLMSDCITLKLNPNNQDFLTFFSKLNHSKFRIFQEKLKGNLILQEVKLREELNCLKHEDEALSIKENELGATFDEFTEAAPQEGTELKKIVPKKNDWLTREPYKSVSLFAKAEIDAYKTYDTIYAYKDPNFINCINMDDATEYLNPFKVMAAMLLLLKKESQKPSADDTGAQSQLFDTEQIKFMNTFFSQNIQKFNSLVQNHQA